MSEDLRLALREFEQMRAKIKKPLTGNAKDRLLAKLAKLSADERVQAQILEQSVDHCWQDVYALKDGAPARSVSSPATDAVPRSFDLADIQALIERDSSRGGGAG